MTDHSKPVASQVLPSSREAVAQQQQQALRELLGYVWRRSAFYRDYYGGHGIKEKDLADVTIGDLPFLSKQVLMENFDSAVTDPGIKRKDLDRWIEENPDPAKNFRTDVIVIHSSGSSGTVGTFVYDQRAWQVANSTMASRLPPPENYPVGKTKAAFYLASHGHFGGISTATRMPKSVYETLILSLGDSHQRVVERLNAFQPHRLQGYASTIATLAEMAIEAKLRISPKRIFVSGDKLTEEMESRIREAWSAPIHNLYSASESKYIAIKEVGRDEMSVIDDLNIVEVLNDNDRLVLPGEAGRVVLTNLYNYLLPILRYELGDYVELGQAQTDAPFATIRDIKGRINIGLPILLDNGSRDSIHPMLLEDFHVPGLEKVQFISQRPDHVQIEYVATDSIDAAIRNEFQRLLNLKNALRNTFGVRRVQQIGADPETGKLNLVRIADQAHRPSGVIAHDDSQPRPMPAIRVSPGRPSVNLGEDEMEQSIADCFERTARLYSDRLAIKTKDRSLTYDELNRAANRLARVILAECREGDEPIALVLDHDVPIVVAILAVLKAGKTYVPLDHTQPEARVGYFLEDSQANIILTDRKTLCLAQKLAQRGHYVINVEEIDATLSDDNLGVAISPDRFACILYTSGSSGQPKGVIQNHRNVIHNAMLYADGCQIQQQDRVTLFAALGTGQGTPTAFSALFSGATLLPYNIREHGVTGLSSWLNREEVSVYISAPTLFRQFVGTLTGQERFPRLRLIRLGAEQIQKSDVELYKKHFAPSCTFAAFLSATETGNLCQYFIDKESEIAGEVVPAGYAVDGVEIALLDDTGAELGFNEVGEIVVKSRYLSPGYWQNSELTDRTFLPDPNGSDKRIYRTGDLGRMLPDGCLEHLGRRDFQVKIRGHRVEIAEIETALMALDLVKEAVVMAREDQSEDRSPELESAKRLVAYIVPAEKRSLTVSTLRQILTEKLPEQMIPAAFVMLRAMPLTPTGKVDRRALPDPGTFRPALDTPYAPPRTTVENELARAWAEVLSLEQIGIHDNFFDLGGHSLAATRIISHVIRRFQLELPIQSLFKAPTIAELAVVIAEHQENKVDEKELDQILNNLESLTHDEVQELLADGSEIALVKFKNEGCERSPSRGSSR